MATGKRVGVLTGGGDCPGLNAVLRAITRKGIEMYDHEILGFRNGWQGPLQGVVTPLGLDDVEAVLNRGGTMLGSSRTNPYNEDDGVAGIKATLADNEVDALIAIGGEDTLGVAERLSGEGIPIVGVPKTIDNDLEATDYTFGFDTAVHIATEAIDRLRTTAESHHRALVVEVMGRHAGWIALHSGLAGGANVILGPEQRFSVEQVCTWVQRRFERQYAPIIVVAEGAVPEGGEEVLQAGEKDAFGHVRLGGVGTWLAEEIAQRTGQESRAVVLGHTQRGGTPTAYDRVLATRFGLHAIDAVHDGDFGTMVALRGTEVVRVPLADATSALKTVPLQRYTEARALFG
ncbi:6-phosphofructokinase 1 [Halopolyspora algeriensis]|uniref:Pyrophosphate--fructose 6-phosphate 1-phosphotransferase n=1 Tax=Halopolyspora algeriensis TaxID=1500506 RepID=A0A368VSS9_9ACTN|nr:6-phosphofructokinase [Halopolyspora algeriensis]RCW44042.1 6-phosphofructokinase 1 [Halopolyspora algeriensis]TQM53459.1 6-phosphofructokinase 1 [Halopolyspora algeriensis]